LPTTLQNLEAHRWVLDGRGPQRPTIAFDDPAIHGSAGCNLFRGRFTLDGQHGIDIDNLSTTRQSCPAETMAAEQAFLTALTAIDSVHVDDDHDHLVLRDDHGHRLAFTAG
jgi:heat shock protein HslJ